MSTTHALIGDRVQLRHPRISDQTAYLELRHASTAFHSPWEPATTPEEDNVGFAIFEKVLATASVDRCERLFVTRRSDGRLVGAVNFNEIVRGAFQSAYLGYWVGEEFARQGYMTEALSLAVRYAFDVLDLHRLEANIVPRNIASLALVKRVGFKKEGYSPRYLKIAGVWEDHERWAITREDWQADQRP